MKKILILNFTIMFTFFGVAFADLASLTRKASSGDAQAQYELGLALILGDYDDPDPEKAVEWFEKAARQGHPEAQYELGTAIFNGDGIKADKVKGCAWLYLSTVEASEYICLSQINAEEREKAKAESEKLGKSIKK